MATSSQTIDYLLEQLSSTGNIRAHKMFGEYALYLNDKVVAFVCDDQLFVKPSDAGDSYMEHCELAPAYPGSKDYLRVSEEQWDNREWLGRFIQDTANALPAPKPKKKVRRGHKA